MFAYHLIHRETAGCGAAGRAGCVISERAGAARGTPAGGSPGVDGVSIGSLAERPAIPAGFLGVSLEYNTVSVSAIWHPARRRSCGLVLTARTEANSD